MWEILNNKIHLLYRKCNSRPLGGTRTLLTALLFRHQIHTDSVFLIISMCMCNMCSYACVLFKWPRASAWMHVLKCLFPWLLLWVVGPLDGLDCEAPQPQLCNTHQPGLSAPVCVWGSGSPHHLYLVGCFSCSAMFASPAPPRHAADHLPKLVPILWAKACHVGPRCATLCRGVPGGARPFNPTAEFIYSQTRESQRTRLWNSFHNMQLHLSVVVFSR